MLALLFAATLILVAGGLGAVGWALAGTPSTIAPSLGLRGLKRQRTLEDSAIFAAVDPFVRLVAPLFTATPGPILDRVERNLRHAGDLWGLTREEFLSLSFLTALFCGGAALVFSRASGLPDALAFFGAGLGLSWPHIAVTGEIGRRRREVNRSLPSAIDLVALCMGAGLDFPAAVRQVVLRSARRTDALSEELGYVLDRMALGRTRTAALESFAMRVPTETVESFVSAVIQSERRGTPLVDTLRIQAKSLRDRRSVAGEQAAARAAVLMTVPLMLIFCAIILVLMGPFLLAGLGSGL